MYKRAHLHPRHPGDIGDIGDIFRKSLKLLDFLQAPDGDILGDIFGAGDKSPASQSFPVLRRRRSLSKTETVRKSESVIDGLMAVSASREKKALTTRG